jgi:hypothetical protein
MNGEQAGATKWKSVWAVLAGFIVIVVTSTAVDAVLHVTGVFPPVGEAMSDGFFVWPPSIGSSSASLAATSPPDLLRIGL